MDLLKLDTLPAAATTRFGFSVIPLSGGRGLLVLGGRISLSVIAL